MTCPFQLPVAFVADVLTDQHANILCRDIDSKAAGRRYIVKAINHHDRLADTVVALLKELEEQDTNVATKVKMVSAYALLHEVGVKP